MSTSSKHLVNKLDQYKLLLASLEQFEDIKLLCQPTRIAFNKYYDHEVGGVNPIEDYEAMVGELTPKYEHLRDTHLAKIAAVKTAITDLEISIALHTADELLADFQAGKDIIGIKLITGA